MPVITVRIKYHKVSITYSFPFCCVPRGSWRDDVCSAVMCTGTTFVLIVLIRSVCCRRSKAKDVLLAGSFWLAALRLTDQSQDILLGHSLCFYWPSYRRIARSISNKFRSGGSLSFESGSIFISAVDWGISSKFGMQIDFHLLKRACLIKILQNMYKNCKYKCKKTFLL